MMMMNKLLSNFLVVASLTTTMIDGFSSQQHHRHQAATTTTTSQLMMATPSSSSSPSQQSRRDILTTTASIAATAAAALVIAPNAATAAAKTATATPTAEPATPFFQGVYFDPKHPDGYRVLRIASGSKVTANGSTSGLMTLSDGLPKDSALDAVEKTYKDLPIAINGNQLTFDFSFKGGPKDIAATLSDDGKKITFSDGNTWTKNKYKFDGVYSVTDTTGKNIIPGAYRVLRQKKERKNKGFTSVVDVEINSGKSNKEPSTFVKARQQGSLLAIPTVDFTFYFPIGKGKDAELEEVVGSLYLVKRNTIAPYGTFVFPDGSRWSQQ